MTNNDSIRFNELYCRLSENNKNIFKDTTIKMLKVNFLLRTTDNDSYMFIINNKELFTLFFEYINFDFNIREDLELAYIKSNDETLINKINKNETLCLLVLSLMYIERKDEISLSDETEISIKEFQDKLFSVGFESQSNDRVKRSTLVEMLKTFRQHNIIYYKGDLSLDDTIITIYPSIEVAMDFKQMDEVVNRLESLKGGDDSDD